MERDMEKSLESWSPLRSRFLKALISLPPRIRDNLFFILLWIPYALLVLRFWFITDDAFISFRYARNWAMGFGPRYNIGDHVPVEGYSNFLWVVLSAIIEYLGAEITFWMPLLSFACGSILLYMVFLTLRRRLDFSLSVSCIAVLSLSLSPPFAVWSTGGLATVPFALLLFITFDRLILRREGIATVGAGLAGVAMALVRVEGIYWALILAPIALISRRMRSQRALRSVGCYLGILISGYALYWAWRYSYYQDLFPNTVYAKSILSAATLMRGANYVIQQYLAFPPLFLALPGAYVMIRRGRAAAGLPAAAVAVGVVCYSILVGGDFMTMARFLVPGLCFNAILLGGLLNDFGRESATRMRLSAALGVAAVLIGLLPAWNAHIVPASIRSQFRFRHNLPNYLSEYEIWQIQVANAETWSAIGRELKAYSDPSDTLVFGGIGAIGYYSELFIYDQYGLTDRDVALRNRSGPLRSPGHDMYVPEQYFLDKKPTIVFPQLRCQSSLQAAIGKMKKTKFARQYVADILPTHLSCDNGEPGYLLLMRRVPDYIDPQTAWNKLDRRLNSIQEN